MSGNNYPGWQGPPDNAPSGNTPPGGSGYPGGPPPGGGYPGGGFPGGVPTPPGNTPPPSPYGPTPGSPYGPGGSAGPGGYGGAGGPGGYGPGGPGMPPGGSPKRTGLIAAIVGGVAVVVAIVIVLVVVLSGNGKKKDEAGPSPSGSATTTSPASPTPNPSHTSRSPSPLGTAEHITMPATLDGMSPAPTSSLPSSIQTNIQNINSGLGTVFSGVQTKVYSAGYKASLLTIGGVRGQKPSAWVATLPAPKDYTEQPVTSATLPGTLRCFTGPSDDCFWGDDTYVVYISDSTGNGGIETAQQHIEDLYSGTLS